MRRLAIAGLALTLAGAAVAAESDLLPMMRDVVDPAANAFWAAGSEPGDEETPPAAAQRWTAAGEGAEAMETYGKLLMQPPHTRPGEWNEYARMMAEAGASGRAAAAARDMDAAFEVGGKLYDACAGCHAAYIPEGG